MQHIDNRLYMESPEKTKAASLNKSRARRPNSVKKNESLYPPSSKSNSGTATSTWQLVCLTEDDWRTFPQQFRSSKDPNEKELYAFLYEHALPMVLESMEVRNLNVGDLKCVNSNSIVMYRKRCGRSENGRRKTNESDLLAFK